jgi:hypothetical protein
MASNVIFMRPGPRSLHTQYKLARVLKKLRESQYTSPTGWTGHGLEVALAGGQGNRCELVAHGRKDPSWK